MTNRRSLLSAIRKATRLRTRFQCLLALSALAAWTASAAAPPLPANIAPPYGDPSRISVAATVAIAVEPRPDGRPAKSGRLWVRRGGDNDRAVTVRMHVSGTAEARRDYVWLATCLGSCAPDRLEATIPAGYSSVEIELLPLADTDAEAEETIAVEVLPSADYELAEPARASFTLRDAAASNLPPVVEFVTPPQTIYRYEGTSPRPVSLLVRAMDPDGSIARVEFFREGKSIGVATRPRPSWPKDFYLLNWEPVLAGTSELKAIVVDDMGATSMITWTGLEVIISQRGPNLAVKHESPVQFDPGSLTLMLEATQSADLPWTNVTFYHGTNFWESMAVLGNVTNPPWVWSVKNLPAGEHHFEASATDASGGVWRAANGSDVTVHPRGTTVVTIQTTRDSVTEGDAELPALVVTRHGGSLLEPLNVPLSVWPPLTGETASLYREIPRIVTIPAGQSEARLLAEPVQDSIYEAPVSVEYTLTFSLGYKGEGYLVEPSMASVHVTIRDDDTDPVFVIASPTTGQRLTADTPVMLRCNYSDAVTADLKDWVEYRVGGRRFGTWSAGGALAVDLPAGEHEIQAAAHLRDGREVAAAPVRVTVNAVTPEPSVRILAPAQDSILPLETTAGSAPVTVRAVAANLQGGIWSALLYDNGSVVATNVLNEPTGEELELIFPPFKLSPARHVLQVQLRTSSSWPRPSATVAVHVGGPPSDAPLARIGGGPILSAPGAIFSRAASGFRPLPMPPAVDRWVACMAATNLYAVDQAGEWWSLSWPGRDGRLLQAPRPLGVKRWRLISGGEQGRAAIGDDGQIYGWDSRSQIIGTGAGSQAVAGEGEVVLPFWRPPDVTGWKEISTSGFHHAAITEDGRLFVWGQGVCPPNAPPDAVDSITYNVRGPQTHFPTLVPFPAGVTRWMTCVAGGKGSYFAIGDDGATYAAGENGGAELDPATTSSYPRRLFRLTLPPGTGRPIRLQSPTYSTASLLAITDNGSVVVWDPAPGSSATTQQLPSPTVIAPGGSTSRWLDGYLSDSRWRGYLLGDDRSIYRFDRFLPSGPGARQMLGVTMLTMSNRFSPTNSISFTVDMPRPTNGTYVADNHLFVKASTSPAVQLPELEGLQLLCDDRYIAPSWGLTGDFGSWRGIMGAGHHSLRVRVFDRDGFNSVSEPVEILVPPHISAWRSEVNGVPTRELMLDASATEFRYALESSTDLQNWRVVGEMLSNGRTNYTIPDAPSAEFYRLRLVE